ncbi:undecaprenyl-diphosphate phosphatase [Erysipelotrichaceae bacterium OH741_COT-311]|nr:undecaprenyl-diphosphate phosphatase [Erysipelotrichaceae bacterium OH741_COT-311]
MLELIKVIVLGIVQGITEWLPISSTGHLILLNNLLSLKIYSDPMMNKEFIDMFTVVIQLGSILAVLLLYFHKLNPFSRFKNTAQKKDTILLWVHVVIAALPAAIVGLLFDDFIDGVLYNSLTVSITLIVYGVLFIVVEQMNKKSTITTLKTMSFQVAFIIGLCQMLALIPGTSRSGATIIGAILIGCSRSVAAEFSFFLAIPMMFGASLLKLVKMKVALTLASGFALMLGTFVAFIVSVFAIRFLMKFIKKYDFKPFGYYRIVLGVIVLISYFLGG